MIRRCLLAIPTLLLTLPLAGQAAVSDSAALAAMHEELLAAHRANDVDRWMALEADTVLSGNNGVVRERSAAERRPGRAGYLAAVHFDEYRDVREPVVTVSDDGTLGWVVAEVEVRGRYPATGEAFADHWAWIELYRKRNGRWLMVGNLSNLRPPG